ncbi:MAG: putative PHD type zinc finger protein with BAH domain-containing protein [Sclerophora amabilis]|nr:MAG: putative PHD type zinc finger protein with BAH domain-containing protein [Sclerophora amabilis]
MAEGSDQPPSEDSSSLRHSTPPPPRPASPKSASHARDAPPPESQPPSPPRGTDAPKDSQQLANGTAADDSQPMVATSSSSSNRSAKDGASTGAGTASPYGTRSRNRTTGARPNYAEDKDIDLDFEYHRAGNTKSSATKSSRSGDCAAHDAAAGPAKERTPSGVSTRRAAAASAAVPTAPAASNGNPAVLKDQIPGTSTFSAHPGPASTAPSSKKRKVAGAGNTSAAQSGAAVGGHTTTRRGHTNTAAGGGSKLSNMLTFELSQGYLKAGKLKADDGTILGVDDHVYLICEPPGEPYYLARIMEFLHKDNEQAQPVDAIRVNWYYRPRDIQRTLTDTRVVFASMHSDTCPLTSLRGKCRISHRSDIQDIDEFRKTMDCFWYDKMFDRYIHRYYEVIPTKQVINVPVKVKKVLDERWKYVIVEIGRGKELTSAVKSCKRCGGYCASNDSVECAVCRSTYHMNCVRPPLLKKPSRGFAWACGPCSRAQEKKLEARNTPIVGKKAAEVEEEEVFDEEEEDAAAGGEIDAAEISPAGTPSQDSSIHPATPEQAAHAKLWPYRYLGIHCRVEDALDYDDRIYPRASSRLGPRHQANVTIWHGRPVELVKPAEIKRKYVKGGSHKKDAKLSKETVAALEADKAAKEKRPRWVVDEPPGYIQRGEDFDNANINNTAKLIFRLPEADESSKLPSRGGDDKAELALQTQTREGREQLIDNYMVQAKRLAKDIGVKEYSTNFLDKALETLSKNKFAVDISLKQLKSVHKKTDLKEPELNKEEQKRFEEGVAKFGSELHSVANYVKTQKEAMIVRYYYMWKKTDRGRQIWGNYEGRKGKKEAKRVDPTSIKLLDDVADDVDDSAFDNDKAGERRRGFQCKFCHGTHAKQWRRAPGVSPGTIVRADTNAKGSGKDKGAQYVLALCHRCAELWRRYGIQWQDLDEATKKAAQGGGKAWKRKIDEEIIKDFSVGSDTAPPPTVTETPILPPSLGGNAVASVITAPSAPEPPKKKLKTTNEKDILPPAAPATEPTPPQAIPKKKVVEKPPEKPAVPEVPKPKVLPCSVCNQMDPVGEQRLSYECVLCPVRYTEHEVVEPPKISHKKKSDKDREKERIEREKATEAADFYRRKQEEMNRPADPREPLKRTAGNNWIHVICSVWIPEMKYGNAKALEPSEGIGTIPPARYEQICKVFHVACAHKAGYTLGFDVTPVKSSRRDMVNTVSLGNESGLMTAEVWCKEHTVKTITHPMHEMADDSGLNALQLFVRNYKQADLTLTGTVRKANLVNQSTKVIAQGTTAPHGNRRASNAPSVNGVIPGAGSYATRRNSVKVEEQDSAVGTPIEDEPKAESKRHCVTCNIDVSPKWWPLNRERPTTAQIPSNQETVSPARHSMMSSSQTQNGYLMNGDRIASSADRSQSLHQRQSPVPMTNGHGPNRDMMENPAVLAAAALTTGPHPSSSGPVSFQCHKCHWKKMREPSPPKAVDTIPHSFPRQPSIPLTATQPQVAWHHPPPPPSLPPSSHYHGWSHQANGSQNIPSASSMTGAPPIHTLAQPPQFSARGPPSQMNGLGTAAPVHVTHPPRSVDSSPLMHQINGALPSPMMTSSPQTPGRPIPHQQHVSNGPLPRMADAQYPHSQPGPLPHPPMYSMSHGSPQTPRDRPTTPRETTISGVHANGSRVEAEPRPLGGASASPSLRNLLS